jgi:hypothetical protein
MFISEIERIVDEFTKIVFLYILVADIYFPIKLREVNIHPIWVFRFVFKKGGILNNITINGIFESVRVAKFIENPVLTLRKIDPIITGRFYCIAAVTRFCKHPYYEQQTEDFIHKIMLIAV